MSASENHIFITGLPRSGTTWVSNNIAIGSNRWQINEPFNWRKHPERKIFHMKYIPPGEKDIQLLAIINQAQNHPSPFHYLKRQKPGTVIKDVHICMAIEYIWLSLQPHVLILLRHPCALAASWSRLKYSVEFRIQNLLSQNLLMADYLDQFRNHMTSNNNYYFSIGAYWGATYYVLNQQSQKYTDWTLINHEDLCADPLPKYIDILENKFNVNITPKQTKKLKHYIAKHNTETSLYRPYNTIRSLNSLKDKWKTELSKQDIRNTLAGAEPFALHQFYK